MGLFSKLKEKLSNKKVFEDKKQEEKYSKKKSIYDTEINNIKNLFHILS